MESRTVLADGVGLHVGVCGDGPDVLVLTGGPGCVQYLARDEISPPGHRAWYPEPRGAGRSGGGPHDFWATHPEVWVRTVGDACASAASTT